MPRRLIRDPRTPPVHSKWWGDQDRSSRRATRPTSSMRSPTRRRPLPNPRSGAAGSPVRGRSSCSSAVPSGCRWWYVTSSTRPCRGTATRPPTCGRSARCTPASSSPRPAALPEFFQPWLTGVRHGQFFSQYTLGWPGLMLIADVLFGSPAAAIVWGTVLAVLGTYVFTPRDHRRPHRRAPQRHPHAGVADAGHPEWRLPRLPLLARHRPALRRRPPRRPAPRQPVVALRRRGCPARSPVRHPAVRRGALGACHGWLRRLPHVARVAPSAPRDRARVRRDPPVPRVDAGAQPHRHRELHRVPVHRQGTARQVRLRLPPSDAQDPGHRLHVRPGRAGQRGQRVLPAPVPGRELPGVARRHGRALAAPT